MSRYIDADKIEYYRDCDGCHEECQLGCTEPFVIAYRAEIDDISTADVIERSEYEKIKFERDISIQQIHNLGNSVSNAIEEIENYYKGTVKCKEQMTEDRKLVEIGLNLALEILKRNIGE